MIQPEKGYTLNQLVLNLSSAIPSARAPMTPTMTVMSIRVSSLYEQGANLPSFFPPTKSIPSAAARSMNGVSEVRSSDFCRAAWHNASDTFCGSKAGLLGARSAGAANSARHSTISSSNYGSAESHELGAALDSPDYPSTRHYLQPPHHPFLLARHIVERPSSVHLESACLVAEEN